MLICVFGQRRLLLNMYLLSILLYNLVEAEEIGGGQCMLQSVHFDVGGRTVYTDRINAKVRPAKSSHNTKSAR